MLRYKFLIFLFLCCLSIQFNAATIKGRIYLDETWAPVVYISVINSFDDLHTAAYNFLRYKIELDSTGYFEVNDLELAEGDLIYRLHICKKGDPESSIIIGGKDENFIHFIMNKNAKTTLVQDGDSQGLRHCKIVGHPSGSSLLKLFDLQKKLDSPPALPSENNRAFIKKQVLNELQMLADTSSNELIRLFAVHFIKESFANENPLELMEKVQNDLAISGYSSSYYDSFLEQLSFMQFQAGKTTNAYSWLKWLGLILIIPVAVFIWMEMTHRQNAKNGNFNQPVQTLSKQEKRVYHLLKSGKSNKEISSELHIEVSTVKSHLHKIYSRLGVKSRKEIVDEEI